MTTIIVAIVTIANILAGAPTVETNEVQTEQTSPATKPIGDIDESDIFL